MEKALAEMLLRGVDRQQKELDKMRRQIKAASAGGLAASAGKPAPAPAAPVSPVGPTFRYAIGDAIYHDCWGPGVIASLIGHSDRPEYVAKFGERHLHVSESRLTPLAAWPPPGSEPTPAPDAPPEPPKWPARGYPLGTLVHHSFYGDGVITGYSDDEDYYTARFDGPYPGGNAPGPAAEFYAGYMRRRGAPPVDNTYGAPRYYFGDRVEFWNHYPNQRGIVLGVSGTGDSGEYWYRVSTGATEIIEASQTNLRSVPGK